MGEIADAMIDGLFCQFCGVLIDGEESGYPRSCDGCGGDDYSDKGLMEYFFSCMSEPIAFQEKLFRLKGIRERKRRGLKFIKPKNEKRNFL